jgi:iron complex outermembrane receptor protein
MHNEAISAAPGRQLATGVYCLACNLGSVTPSGFYQVNNDVEQDRPTHSYDADLRLQYVAGPLTFQSITAYRELIDTSGTDVDTSELPLFQFHGIYGGKTYSEDAQVSSQFKGMFDFLAGIQYVSDHGIALNKLSGLAFGAPYDVVPGLQPDQKVLTESYAGFAEAYFRPINRLTVTLGGRYTRDHRKISSTISPDAIAAFNPGGPSNFSQTVSYNKFTPRAVIAYDAGLVNLYASYTKGFKAGGFNTPSFAPQTVPIRPENMESYEVGAKFTSADRRIRLNTAVFRYSDKDVQVSTLDLIKGGQVFTNASSARGRGVELEVNYSANRFLEISAGGDYLDAIYTSYPNATVYDASPGGYVNGVEDLSGTPLPRSPRWSGFLAPNLEAPLGQSGFVARLSPVIRYTTGYDFEPGAGGPPGYDRQRPLALLSLSAGIKPSSGRYEIGFYADNLLNRRYYDLIVTGNFGVAGYVARPRTYGARLRVKF